MGPEAVVAHHRARVAALSRWAAEPDPAAATLPARKAFLERFTHEVDPLGQLPEDERTRRALLARKAFMARLTLARVSAASKKDRAQSLPAQLVSDGDRD